MDLSDKYNLALDEIATLRNELVDAEQMIDEYRTEVKPPLTWSGVRLKLERYEEAIAPIAAPIVHHQVPARFLKTLIGTMAQEHFVCLALDAQHKLLAYHLVHIGTANTCMVDAGAVMRTPLLVNASALIVAHNHPSGGADPSRDDWAMTAQLGKAAKILGLKLLDHLIVTADEVLSMSAEDTQRWERECCG